MDEEPSSKSAEGGTEFSRKVGMKETRKLKARRAPRLSVWAGFGLFGLIGWSVAIPTLLGVALGVWIDRRFPGQRSWTLMLMVIGLVLGCLNAWRWVAKENRDIHREREEKNDE